MLFVSINFSLEKDSVVFSAFVNYNIMLCIEFSSLRLKCDMGDVFSIALKAGRVHRPVGSLLEFQQNEPQNQ